MIKELVSKAKELLTKKDSLLNEIKREVKEITDDSGVISVDEIAFYSRTPELHITADCFYKAVDEGEIEKYGVASRGDSVYAYKLFTTIDEVYVYAICGERTIRPEDLARVRKEIKNGR